MLAEINNTYLSYYFACHLEHKKALCICVFLKKKSCQFSNKIEKQAKSQKVNNVQPTQNFDNIRRMERRKHVMGGECNGSNKHDGDSRQSLKLEKG